MKQAEWYKKSIMNWTNTKNVLKDILMLHATVRDVSCSSKFPDMHGMVPLHTQINKKKVYKQKDLSHTRCMSMPWLPNVSHLYLRLSNRLTVLATTSLNTAW
jgi:hypothetical protein